MRNAKGQLLYLEKPRYGIMVKDGIVVNEEMYNLFMERQKQNAVAPVKSDPELAEKTKQFEAEMADKKYKDLEQKVDKLTSLFEKVITKLDEK